MGITVGSTAASTMENSTLSAWTWFKKNACPAGRRAGALAFTARWARRRRPRATNPAILTEWGRVTVTWWTHKIKGLHRNDFIMAARTDRLYGAI